MTWYDMYDRYDTYDMYDTYVIGHNPDTNRDHPTGELEQNTLTVCREAGVGRVHPVRCGRRGVDQQLERGEQ